MLVIAPLVLIVIGVIVSAMIAMIGDTLVANSRSDTAYSLQDSLSQIEQDTRVATGFMSTFSYFSSPQGRNGSTQAFSYSSNRDLIITQQATTASPYNDSRDLVYFANQPNACDLVTPANMSSNRFLNLRIVYFLDANKTLWRRTIMNSWNMSSTADGNTVCSKPWQRSSCPLSSTLSTAPGATCQAYDQRMLDNVTSFVPTFYTSSGTTTSNPAIATNVSVAISTSQSVSGSTITQTSTVRATRRNDVPATPVPSTPTIALYQQGVADQNNSHKVSVQWASTNAYTYEYRIKLGSGAWSAVKTTASTILGIDSTPGTTVSVEVRGVNDSGKSSATVQDFTTGIFTDFNLYGGWECYGSATYFCPQFAKTSSNIVMLHGLVKAASSAPATIAVLPEGFRPAGRLIFPVLTTNNILGRLDILSDGTVSFQSGDKTGWISLDNIQFPPNTSASAPFSWSQPASFGCGTGCTTPWRQYSGTYQEFRFAKDTYGRSHLYGLLRTEVPYPAAYNALIADVPTSPDHRIRAETNRNLIVFGLSNNSFASAGINYSTINYRGGPGNWQSFNTIYPSRSYTGTWNDASLQNSWVNFGGNFANAQYSKEADNLLMLEGTIKSGTLTDNTTLLTLPSGYRPSKRLIFPARGRDTAGDDTLVRIEISSGGVVSVRTTPNISPLSNASLNLDSIQFYVDGN